MAIIAQFQWYAWLFNNRKIVFRLFAKWKSKWASLEKFHMIWWFSNFRNFCVRRRSNRLGSVHQCRKKRRIWWSFFKCFVTRRKFGAGNRSPEGCCWERTMFIVAKSKSKLAFLFHVVMRFHVWLHEWLTVNAVCTVPIKSNERDWNCFSGEISFWERVVGMQYSILCTKRQSEFPFIFVGLTYRHTQRKSNQIEHDDNEKLTVDIVSHVSIWSESSPFPFAIYEATACLLMTLRFSLANAAWVGNGTHRYPVISAFFIFLSFPFFFNLSKWSDLSLEIIQCLTIIEFSALTRNTTNIHDDKILIENSQMSLK